MLTGAMAFGQNKDYLGEWSLSKSDVTDPCAKDQQIILKKDGAEWHAGKNEKNCRAQSRTFKNWKVEKRDIRNVTMKNGKKDVSTEKKDCLVLEDRIDPIVLVIEEKKKKTMKVKAYVTGGDSTRQAAMEFEKTGN